MFRQQSTWRFVVFILVGLNVVTSVESADPGSVRLADFKRVVIDENPCPVQQAAALDLAGYVGQINGTPLEIISINHFERDNVGNGKGLSFFVGEGPASRILGKSVGPWKSEEWLLQSVPEGLIAAGQDGTGDAWSLQTPAGSMLAVYTFLEEHLGVRWFWPGEHGEHVPHDRDASVPKLSIRRTPAFEIRSVKLGYSQYHTPTFKDAERKWARRSRLGWVRSAVFGHSWDAAFELRKGETLRQHPDWFALVRGSRQPPQMCTTHPDVLNRMVEYVLDGKSDIMNISPSDGGGFCECERCQALDVAGVLAYDNKHVQLSDRIFTYANEIARRVKERNPNKGCGMFAYTYYNRPPVNISHLEPNLYLSFVYQSAAHRNPASLQKWRESVAGWQKIGAKMVVREGWGNHYYHDLPFIHYRQIVANLAEAHRLGFVAAYGEGSKSFATQGPNNWAITHAMWDPERSGESIMRDFYDSAYGPVAKEMEAYFESYQRALDENWSQLDRNVDSTEIAYANIVGAWGRLFPNEVLASAEQHLRSAERKAPPGEYSKRIEFHRFGQDYTVLMVRLLTLYRELAILGVKLDTFSSVTKERRDNPDQREALLREAFELGEKREAMLLAHRDWAGPDEGLYAYTNDAKIRQWHTAVKRELGHESPTRLTKEKLVDVR